MFVSCFPSDTSSFKWGTQTDRIIIDRVFPKQVNQVFLSPTSILLNYKDIYKKQFHFS